MEKFFAFLKRWWNRNETKIVWVGTFTQQVNWDDGAKERLIFTYTVHHYFNKRKYELRVTPEVQSCAYPFSHIKYYYYDMPMYKTALEKLSEFQHHGTDRQNSEPTNLTSL